MTIARGLSSIRAIGLPLSWGLVRLGWEGVGDKPRLVSLDDIRAFASDQIATASESQLPDVADLCTVYDEAQVQEQLERLAPAPSAVSLRIWRAALLDELLRTLPASPVDARAELTSFWASFGYPPDSPHTIQGLGNDIRPSDYYTAENAKKACAAHRLWLDAEINELRNDSAADHNSKA